MPDTDDSKLKAEIDQIMKKVDTIIKNIEALDPAKKEYEKQSDDEECQSSEFSSINPLDQ